MILLITLQTKIKKLCKIPDFSHIPSVKYSNIEFVQSKNENLPFVVSMCQIYRRCTPKLIMIGDNCTIFRCTRTNKVSDYTEHSQK